MGDTGNLIGLMIALRSCAYEKDADKASRLFPQISGALSGFPDIQLLIFDVLDEVRTLFDNESYEQAYDLIDAIHCLPEIAADENRNMGRYWRTHIAAYQEKYDTDFFSPYKSEIMGM